MPAAVRGTGGGETLAVKEMRCPYSGVSAAGGAMQGSTLLRVRRSMCSPVSLLLYT